MQEIRRVGYFLVLIIGLALTTAFVWRPAPPAKFTGLSSIPVPVNISGYYGVDVPVDAVTKTALNSADILSRKYTDASGREIDLTLIGGTDRSALHDPRSCLVGAGWKIDNDRVEELRDSAGSTIPARTCTATISEDDNAAGYDILYLYVTHHKVIASATEIRLALLEGALLEQNDAPVYFLRFMTPLTSQPDQATEHQALSSFATQLWDQVSPAILRGKS